MNANGTPLVVLLRVVASSAARVTPTRTMIVNGTIACEDGQTPRKGEKREEGLTHNCPLIARISVAVFPAELLLRFVCSNARKRTSETAKMAPEREMLRY